MQARRHLFSPAIPLLLAVGLASWGCRASDEGALVDRPGSDPRAEVEADLLPVMAPHPALGDDGSIEESRLARVDARLLDLQATINQLELTGADRVECELHWEELDGRRSALRREEQGLGSEVTPSDRDERRRTLAEDLDDLESDLEAAIQEVESRLSRG